MIGFLVAQALATLSGQVRERGTREPVAYASVIVESAAGASVARTETDEQGGFTLEVAPGTYQVTVLAGDYLRFSARETLAAGQRSSVRYFLERRRYGRYETVVRGRPAREEVTRQSLETEEIVKIPGTVGDALRSIENLPGVARAPFNSGILVVRGSPPEDSLILLDGHQLPQLYHFGGLTSVVNSDLVQRIDFLPGNASVRYGRFLGGVVDVVPREPRRDGMHGYVNTSVFDTGGLVEGPAGSGGGFALAARRSYIDVILPALLPDSAGINLTTAPRYYDYQAILSQPAAGGRLHVYLYGSDDRLTFVAARPADDPSLRGTYDTTLYFHNLYASWAGPLGGSGWTLRASMQPGFQHSSASVGEETNFRIEYLNLDQRLELAHGFAGDRVRFSAGLDVETLHYDGRARVPRAPVDGDVQQMPFGALQRFDLAESGWDLEPAAWAEVALAASSRLTVTPGVRVDLESVLGHQQLTLDPRIALRYAWSGRTTLRAGAGLFHEPPAPQYSDLTLGSPFVRAEAALHYSVGIDHQLAPSWRLESTAFYKALGSLVAASPHSIVYQGKVRPEVYSNDGSGRVVGFELLLRRELARGLFGWLAYTLLSSERRDAPGQPLHPSDFDQTHVLTAVVSWKFVRTWEAGVRFRYATGNPYTPVAAGIYDADHDLYLPLPGPKDSDRLPAFNQLDARIDKRWVFDRWMLTAYLDVQNVLNHSNTEFILHNFDYSQTAPVTGLPIIPALGIKGEF